MFKTKYLNSIFFLSKCFVKRAFPNVVALFMVVVVKCKTEYFVISI